jgi:hypothetical protein
MSLRPRHYILLAVVLGLFVYNIVRHRHDDRNAIPQPAASVRASLGPPVDTPAWRAFDHAAALKDAPPATFDPALAALHTELGKVPSQDIEGCLVWLEFYRQGMAQTRTDSQMRDRSLHHLAGCTRFHLDTTA